MPMQYRSTNVVGYSHHGGALVVGVELESGIELNPTSSGSAPRITAAGDETNKGIVLEGKGTGSVTIGNSSQTVTIAGGTGFKGFQTSSGNIQIGAISSGQTVEVALSTAATGVAVGDLISAIELQFSTNVCVLATFRVAADATTRVTFVIGNISSTATSTSNANWRIVYADLT